MIRSPKQIKQKLCFKIYNSAFALTIFGTVYAESIDWSYKKSIIKQRKRWKKHLFLFFTISLVFGHATIPVNHLLDPRRHRLHQVMQEIRFRCPLEPDQEDGRLPLVHVGAIVTGQLLLHPGPHCLDWIEVRWVARPPYQLDLRPCSPVCDCWVSIAVLCQENDVGFNLYRLASDEKFSSENGEISYSSSHIHALLVQKIWWFYLVQEKSYWHKKTGQYFPCIL